MKTETRVWIGNPQMRQAEASNLFTQFSDIKIFSMHKNILYKKMEFYHNKHARYVDINYALHELMSKS